MRDRDRGTLIKMPSVGPRADRGDGVGCGTWIARMATGVGEARLTEDTEHCDVRQRAGNFERVREAHRQEVAEDYCELIAELIAVTGEARAVDLAERLGVTQATVTKAIARLAREGWVTTQKYRSIFLTPAGAALAERSRTRHQLVKRFLIALGVDAETAEADAEGVEHHVSEATLQAMARFLEARHDGQPA